jgi:hypothetical protein
MAAPTLIASYGGGTSNVYVTYAAANAYFDTKVSRDSWDSATEPQRQAALMEATRHIDSRVWRGKRYYYEQLLEFPRTMYEDDPAYPGEVYAVSVISSPANVDWRKMEQRVKDACCEQALHILELSGDDSIAQLKRRGVTSYSESIGKISESYQFGGGSSVLCSEAARLLSWYTASPRIVRG